MATNPYAPPEGRVADPEPVSHGLKQRRVLVMIVFMIITLGIYYLVWWFRRRPGLNRLNSPQKLALWPLLLLTAQFVGQFVIGVIAGITLEQDVIGEGGRLFMTVFQLMVGIVIIVQTFKIKDMIEDHAQPVQSYPMSVEQVKLSGLMTFFFSIFYLQWAINRYVVGTESHGEEIARVF
jgi:magnesium-transporting ATPase (P-type)